VARAGEVAVSANIQECCNVKEVARQAFPGAELRLLSPAEEAFISRMYSISEEKLAEENFTVEHLCRYIGMSRPQLYRKTVLLTGKSPNDFIRDLRMEKALTLIRKKAGNIAEIALEVGYNNPSYFARCFQLRYGCSPSRFVE
jgi:AraC-like DNA-binding protein